MKQEDAKNQDSQESTAGKCMQHWNGNQLCAIDIETTGFEPWYHEIIQICILPLDCFIKPRKDVLPFNVLIQPEHPRRASADAKRINKDKWENVLRHGIDTEKVKDLLEDWITKLGLPYTKWGTQKRIIPLAQNYAFDKAFIQKWLGVDMYNHWFDSRHRDTLQTAQYLNDLANMQNEPVPFPKQNLTYLCNCLDVEIIGAHDALVDAKATAECYRKMLMMGPIQ